MVREVEWRRGEDDARDGSRDKRVWEKGEGGRGSNKDEGWEDKRDGERDCIKEWEDKVTDGDRKSTIT